MEEQMFEEVWARIRAYLDNEQELKVKEEPNIDNINNTYLLENNLVYFA